MTYHEKLESALKCSESLLEMIHQLVDKIEELEQENEFLKAENEVYHSKEYAQELDELTITTRRQQHEG